MNGEVSREILGNIDPLSRIIFYVLAGLSTGVFAYGVWRKARRWNMKQLLGRPRDWVAAMRQVATHALLQRKLRRGERTGAGTAHVALFGGFVILFIGTVLVAIEHYGAALVGREAVNPIFHRGLYFAVFELVLDLGGLALLAGCGWFMVRRARATSSMEHHWTDSVVLMSLIFIGVSGYLIEGARIIIENTAMAGFSPVGWLVAQALPQDPSALSGIKSFHKITWWLHTVAALGFVAAVPYCRLLHIVAGTLNIGLRDYTFGALKPISMGEVEETGKLGLAQSDELTGAAKLALDACVSCGRCEDSCPAHAAGKPLSPRDLVQSVRLLSESPTPVSLHGEAIKAETLWACTTCGACVEQCPVEVAPLDFIGDMRRHLIGEGGLAGAPATTLQKTQRAGNPWGLPSSSRLHWAEGLDVPTVNQNPNFDLLYWVGCSASYDPRAQKVARAVAQLLQKAKVNFACLGPEERCTGDFARRMGDEFLFQELAMTNIETLERHSVRRIVTHCPHCLNSIAQDYPQFEGNYEVIHHSQLLAELIEQGRLKPTPTLAGKVTYHDPCYLARAQGIVDEPRRVLQSVAGTRPGDEWVEMKRCGKGTACCGGGGGRMWFDDQPVQRVGRDRMEEILTTQAQTVAVSCPFCMTMATDGLAALGSDVVVKDIAEILNQASEEPMTN
ncbi:MAG: heterodisulfide reductase-related iron-sulfur binding cluster [Synoicihabitans sp.]